MKIPATLRDECQRMLAIHIYMSSSILAGPDMKEKDQQKRIENIYHGLPKGSDSESMFMVCRLYVVLFIIYAVFGF